MIFQVSSVVIPARSRLYATIERGSKGPRTETVFLAKAHRKPSAACLSRRG
jgi:hypothetical protein